MAVKPNKENSSKKAGLQKNAGTTGNTAKTKKQDEEDEIVFEDDEKVTKGGKKTTLMTSESDDTEDEDNISVKKGGEDEENWDPDFDEFDLPKSSKKVSFGKKEVKDNDDEFKVDEEFQDYFNSPSKKKYNDADDDY